MTKEEAFKIGLPKWPQCVINGDKITKEQALEIIRRTDSFFHGHYGNDKSFYKHGQSIIKRPQYNDFDDYDTYHNNLEEWRNKWGLISTNYLSNDWVSSCFIHGPYGWCHPDGTIEYHYNIGKWPDVEEVYNDLQMLGNAFPFLNMTLTLMSNEYCCERYSLVSMKLSNGNVEIIDTIPINKLKIPKDKPIRFNLLGNYDREHAISLDQIQKWADQVFKNKGDN